MRCEQIMKRDIECLSEQDTVADAARKMEKANVGFLPVCDAEKRAVGTLTDRDIALRVSGKDRPATTRVADVMTREVVACRPTDDVRVAEARMGKNKKSRIMVADEAGKLQGVISLSDIAERDSEHAARTMREVSSREVKAA